MACFTAAEARRVIIAGDAPAGMHVKGNLDFRSTTVTALPEGLNVGGGLDLTGTAMTSLPAGLSVGGNLNLTGTAITALPNDLIVRGSLDLGCSAITSLPAGLRVGGSLYLDGTAITTLPDGLSVGGSLFLRSTLITRIPQGLVVRVLMASPHMSFPTAWFALSDSTVKWRALACEGECTLIENESGQIVAGCRGPWSSAEALAHWGAPARTDELSRRFAAALRRLPDNRPVDAVSTQGT